MRTGGISGRNIMSYWISTLEILKSFKINNIKNNLFLILIRIPAKISQFLNFNEKKINRKFDLFKFLFDQDHYLNNSFKIIKHPQKIPFDKNFILSGMNLAFLGYYSNKEVYPDKNLYHWPDGIWSQKHINLEKLPGRDLLQLKSKKD